MGRPASAADGDTVKIEVGDWVKFKSGSGSATASPARISIVEVENTWKNGDEHFINGHFYLEQYILEVRPPNKEPR